jgi:PAS domain S-box-containing protein
MDIQNNNKNTLNTGHLNNRVKELEMSLKIYQEESIRKRDILETSRDYLQSVIDNISDLILVIDTGYRVILSNKKLKNTINGIDPAQKGLLCHNLSHLGKNSCKDNKQSCPMKKVLKSKSPVSITRMHVDENGNSKFFDIVAAPLFSDSGGIVHIIESFRDVTERVKTEQALMHSETRYRSLFEQSNDAICIFQPEGADKGKILSANRAAGIMHGYTNGELLQLSIPDLMYSKKSAGIFPDIKSPSISDNLRQEIIHRKKNGELFPKPRKRRTGLSGSSNSCQKPTDSPAFLTGSILTKGYWKKFTGPGDTVIPFP